MSGELNGAIRAAIASKVAAMGAEGTPVTLEVPPKAEFGDLACPVAFELAKQLKRAPRDIAGELRSSLEALPGVARVDVAGAGYLNIHFDREAFMRALASEIGKPRPPAGAGKRIVEHTNINPNKAAHIGHLRNAVLGDTLVRCLRFLGHTVEVQNYIDDTGVQVADLAVGFVAIRGLGLDDVRRIAMLCAKGASWTAPTRSFHAAAPAESASGGGSQGGFAVVTREFPPGHAFDHYCWDLYAEVAPFYEASPQNAALRGAALEEMEEGRGPYAEIAAFVSREMVLHHLRTMRWIGVRYDLLPRESDILALGFWQAAFGLLQETGAIRFATEGKAKGCWVMDLPDAAEPEEEGAPGVGLEKIIVRSNGTVTYVGKDIAYQMWKFGLLGRDFHYDRLDPAALPANDRDRLFSKVGAGLGASAAPVWRSSSSPAGGEPPAFGRASRVYNVIDVRQSYLQMVVSQGLTALGHAREAAESVHFAYEMVALTPRSMEMLGRMGLVSGPATTAGGAASSPVTPTDEDRARPYVEMSGRRGIGVKAEDLLCSLASTSGAEIDKRTAGGADSGRPDAPPALDADARALIAAQIAVGALRYYMLRFTKNRVVAFDVEDSLAFEGETGPYLQYAAVRSRNIFHKLGHREGFDRARAHEIIDRARFDVMDAADAIEHWKIVREIARLPEIVEQAVDSLELSTLARFAFSVSQMFSSFYHRYPILQETDLAQRELRVALNELYLRFMETCFRLMGIPLPERM